MRGSFRIIASKNIVEIITKNSRNEDVVEKVKYHFENGLLHMSMEWDDLKLDLVLEKD